jgi:hypothetical protein
MRGSGPAEWDNGLGACGEILRIDTRTGRRVVREAYDGTIRFDGYGVAILTNAAATTVLD